MIDFHIWPFVERFCIIKAFTGQDAITEAEFPRLSAWVAAMLDLPAVKALLNTKEHHVAWYRVHGTGGVPDYDMHLKWTRL